MTPPVIKRPVFYAALVPEGADPDTTEDTDLEVHRVIINSGDQLRAELEASKLGLARGGRDAPMHVSALWLWAAMVRTGRFTGDSKTFRDRLAAYEPDRDRPEPHTDPDAGADDDDPRPTAANTG